MNIVLSNDLHITIGVHPVNSIDSSNNINLGQEIKLIKAALLYADKVKIYSAAASTLQIALQLSDLSINEQFQFMEMVFPYLMNSSPNTKKGLVFLRALQNPQIYRSIQNEELKGLIDGFANQWVEIKRVLSAMSENAGMGEINAALNSGILEIHQIPEHKDKEYAMRVMADYIALASNKKLPEYEMAAIHSRNSEMTKEFVSGILDSVVSGSTYPLFDADTGKLANLAQEAGIISTGNIDQKKARQISLANGLFQILPVFEQASVKDILLLRTELKKYLVRFRKSIIEFSSSVASNPWDNSFEKEVDILIRKEIEPAILDLNDEIKSNNFIEKLARQAVDKPLLLAPGAALSLVLSQIPNLPNQIVGALGIGAGAATLVYNAYKEWSDKQNSIERTGLYFYYQSNRKLTKRKNRRN
jgi:hypothetical protein